MRPWQLTVSSTTRHPLFPTEALRIAAVLAIVRVVGDALVLFGIVDDHLHIVALCDRAFSGRLARSLKLSLRPVAAVPLGPVHISAIHGRNHMLELHRYILQQPAHHGLSCHPALWSGSCFIDLVGGRWIPGLRLRLEDVLPRSRPEDSYTLVGLPRQPLAPMALDEIRSVGPKALVEAASLACAADPALIGRRAETARTRRVACTLARKAGIPTSEISWALRIHPGSARKMASTEAAPEALRATRTCLSLIQAARAMPPLSQLAPERRDRPTPHIPFER